MESVHHVELDDKFTFFQLLGEHNLGTNDGERAVRVSSKHLLHNFHGHFI